jgi:arylsulfate sulfotransferase
MMHASYIRMAGLLILSLPAIASVDVVSVRPSHGSPQPLGTLIDWTAQATDSNSGPLTFQFWVAPPRGSFALVKDFNVGTLASGVWTSASFAWYPAACRNVTQPTGVVAYTCQPLEGVYQIQVVVKDFTSGETASKTVRFQVTALVSGGSAPLAAPTANPLVALFSAPSCATGSFMRVSFQPQSGATPAQTTNWVACSPIHTTNFEIAGMYPNTAYHLIAQTRTGTHTVNSAPVSYTTGALPGDIAFPTFVVNVGPGPDTDTTDFVLLHNMVRFGNTTIYPNVATDLSGNILWYYSVTPAQSMVLSRPLQNGTMLTLQNGLAWSKVSERGQFLRQIDLAGNILLETNTGVLQKELQDLGAEDAQACDSVPRPAPVGSACLGFFHHDAIQTLPSGYTAAWVDIEKIFPPGTQGDTSGLPVDIVGDMIVVLDTNWQAIWYFDTFEHDNGPPQLDIDRAAVLGETCSLDQQGCPPLSLLGAGIAPAAKDWLHANSIYYWPQTGDIIWSSRNQDWVMRIDYNNGAGTGNILWRLGREGDFTFNNIGNDPWPWFSHQHEVGIEDNGTGVMSLFDNGDTRVSKPPLGLGSHCGPDDCDSRGMALTVDQANMQVTPVLSADLGVYSEADGSAQLLSDGNYFFLPAVVFVTPSKVVSQSLEIYPSAGTLTGPKVLNVQTTEEYRAWQMPNLYNPPIT